MYAHASEVKLKRAERTFSRGTRHRVERLAGAPKDSADMPPGSSAIGRTQTFGPAREQNWLL